jgi:hypothetical protein
MTFSVTLISQFILSYCVFLNDAVGAFSRTTSLQPSRQQRTPTIHQLRQSVAQSARKVSDSILDDHDDPDLRLGDVLDANEVQLAQSILSASTERLADVITRHSVWTHHPALIDRILQPNAYIQSTEEWLFRYLGVSTSDAKKIHLRWPNSNKCFKRLGRLRLHEWLAYFLSNEVGMSNAQLRKMIVSRPRLLAYKLSKVQSTATYFREELELSCDEFASILQAYPSVLMHSIDNRLRPNTGFLQNEIGGGKDNWTAWKSVICSYPNVYSHSLEKTLLPKVAFLSNSGEGNALGLNKSELSLVISKFPPILWLSEENLRSKLAFLSDSLELSGQELRTIVVTYPQILGLSVEKNLQHKMEFFLNYSEENCGILSKAQLKEFVLYQPALLAYSLEGRLKPRIRLMQEHNISFYYSPKSIMSYTNDKFDLW